MKAPKRVLTLTTAEHRLMVFGLLQWRNKLFAQGRYTDALDELLIKLQKGSFSNTTASKAVMDYGQSLNYFLLSQAIPNINRRILRRPLIAHSIAQRYKLPEESVRSATPKGNPRPHTKQPPNNKHCAPQWSAVLV